MRTSSLVRKAYESFRVTFEMGGALDNLSRNLPATDADGDFVKRYLDCAVITHLHKMREEENEPHFDTVRSPFVEGKPLYPGAGIMQKTHIQICVCNPDKIVGYFKPRNL